MKSLSDHTIQFILKISIQKPSSDNTTIIHDKSHPSQQHYNHSPNILLHHKYTQNTSIHQEGLSYEPEWSKNEEHSTIVYRCMEHGYL